MGKCEKRGWWKNGNGAFHSRRPRSTVDYCNWDLEDWCGHHHTEMEWIQGKIAQILIGWSERFEQDCNLEKNDNGEGGLLILR